MKFALGTIFTVPLSTPGVLELNHNVCSCAYTLFWVYEVWLNRLGSLDIKKLSRLVEFFMRCGLTTPHLIFPRYWA